MNDEEISLMDSQSMKENRENGSISNTNLNSVASINNSHEITLQKEEVDDLLSLLERAQALLKNQAQETGM